MFKFLQDHLSDINIVSNILEYIEIQDMHDISIKYYFHSEILSQFNQRKVCSVLISRYVHNKYKWVDSYEGCVDCFQDAINCNSYYGNCGKHELTSSIIIMTVDEFHKRLSEYSCTNRNKLIASNILKFCGMSLYMKAYNLSNITNGFEFGHIFYNNYNWTNTHSKLNNELYNILYN